MTAGSRAAPWSGRASDSCWPISNTGARKGDGRRYRYYVSQALLQNRPDDAGSVPRIPAQMIEDLVVTQLGAEARSAGRCTRATAADPTAAALRASVRRVEIEAACVRIALADRTVTVPIRFKNNGRAQAAVSSGAARPAANAALIKAVARAWDWREALIQGRSATVADLAEENGFTERYVRATIPLAFLAPDLLAAIVAGRQPRRLDLQALRGEALPLSWAAQRDRLGG